jgi:hypothetical protein
MKKRTAKKSAQLKRDGKKARAVTRYKEAASTPVAAPATLVAPEGTTLQVSDGLLAQLGSAVVIRRPVRPYSPPPGVIPSAAIIARQNAMPHGQKPYLAMDNANMVPGGSNFFAWQQTQNCGLGFPGYAYLSELSQRSEYRAPSETIAKEMTRKWIKFVSRSKDPKAADKFKKLEAAFKKFDVRQIWRKTLELDMFMGRAQIYINIEGSDNDVVKAQPLEITDKTVGKGKLVGFKVIEPIWTSPLTYNSQDATAQDFYSPNAWFILGKRVHHTRLITVISRPMPDLLKPAYNFGGISLTQLMEPYVLRWLKTVDNVNKIISNFSNLILKSNLQTVLAGKSVDGTGILNRAKLFTLTRDNQGLTLLDKNSEEMEQIAVPLSGLSELQAQAQEHMAAPSHVPLVKLTGITPSGLNASSEGEITVFHEFVGSEQETVVEPGLDKIFDLIQLNEFGAIDEDLDYEFVPLVETTQKEVADTRKANTEMITGLITAGVIDADEGREALRTDPDSGLTHLEGDAPEPQPDINTIDPETGQPYAPPAPPGGSDAE